MKTLALSFILFLNSYLHSQNFWQPLNGPNGSVYVAQISLSPNGQLFLSTLGGGIYRSSDNGNTWVQKVNGFPGPIFDDGTVIFAFNNSGHIYATSFTEGIWRSTNNGDSWTQTGSNNIFIVALGINQAGYIFAGHGGGGGVYRSTDNGSSWNQVNNGLPQPFAVYSILAKPGGLLFVGGNNTLGPCIFKSTNAGAIWQYTGLATFRVNSLALNTNGDIYAGTGYLGIYRSTNNGDNWSAVNNGLSCLRINQVFCNFQGHTFAATDSGLFRSTNYGNSWTSIGFSNKYMTSFLSLSNGSYFAGANRDGLLRSTNNGSNWIELNNGLNALTVYSITINQSGHIFAGVDNRLIHKSTDNGNTWQPLQNGLKGTTFNALACSPNNYLYARSDSGVFRSTDNGNNWINVFGSYFPFNDFVFRQNGYIYAPSSYPGFGVWVSTNSGLNWNMTNLNFSASVYSLAINQSGYLFAGTSGGGVYRSTDFGLNWTQTGPFSSVTAIASAPNGYIYAAMQSVSGGSDGIYRSTNNGANWQYMGLGLVGATSMKINSSGHVYVSSLFMGVYRSTDNGSTWTRLSSGMFNNMVWCLAFNQQGYLYAGTWGNSIYRSVNSTIGIQQISNQVPKEFILSQNYPNPFNPTTNIEFAIPKQSFVKLMIYEIQGLEVEILVNENLKAGIYRADWNASKYTSGIYFYKLVTNDFAQTKKMILIK